MCLCHWETGRKERDRTRLSSSWALGSVVFLCVRVWVFVCACECALGCGNSAILCTDDFKVCEGGGAVRAASHEISITRCVHVPRLSEVRASTFYWRGVPLTRHKTEMILYKTNPTQQRLIGLISNLHYIHTALQPSQETVNQMVCSRTLRHVTLHS